MVRENHHASPRRRSLTATAFQPLQLRGAHRAIPRLRLRQFSLPRVIQRTRCNAVLRTIRHARVRADVVRIQNHEARVSVIEMVVTSRESKARGDPWLLVVKHLEVVIAEQLIPPVATWCERATDFGKTAPLAIDQVPKVRAKRQVLTLKLLHRRTELCHRCAVVPGPLALDVRILRVGGEAEREAAL
jgi:hypothetical protein